jgi:hypothetical protein
VVVLVACIDVIYVVDYLLFVPLNVVTLALAYVEQWQSLGIPNICDVIKTESVWRLGRIWTRAEFLGAQLCAIRATLWVSFLPTIKIAVIPLAREC